MPGEFRPAKVEFAWLRLQRIDTVKPGHGRPYDLYRLIFCAGNCAEKRAESSRTKSFAG